ncbi:MAG: ABC transporter permease [Candidatus Aminicenantes bacterium]|nr:ABC transporter permease [Candidatus Aminicenantes bacterium]
MRRIIKSTCRNFQKRPVTSLINVLGLALSLAFVIILSAYCYSELTADSHQENADRVFLLANEKDLVTTNYAAITPGILKQQLDLQVPAVRASVRVAHAFKPPVFEAENRGPLSSELAFADASFFELFTYRAISGHLETALMDPRSLVLTESEAVRLFGTPQAVGRTVRVNNEHWLTVTAVVAEPERKSCLSVKAVAPVALMPTLQQNSGEFTKWEQRNFLTFVLLEKDAGVAETAATLTDIFPPEVKKAWEIILVPLRDIYLSKVGHNPWLNYVRTGDKQRVMILLTVAFLILLIAVINFINISSSHWLERIKPMGVQKIIGAGRFRIFRNIVAEACLIFLVSLSLAVVVAYTASPYINSYTGIGFARGLLFSPFFLGLSVLSAVVLGLASSLFPALRISRSHPVDNLKRTVTAKAGRSTFRGMLVIFQFSTAIMLIAFTLLIQKQVRFACRDVGFEKENIVGIKMTEQLREKSDVLRNRLLELPAVEKVSFSQFFPGIPGLNVWGTELLLNGEKKKADFNSLDTEAGFLEILGIKLIKGRLFSADRESERGKVVVNETFLIENGIADPIGATFSNPRRQYEIIGVVKDFHFKPMDEPITPLAIVSSRVEDMAGFFPMHGLILIQAGRFETLHGIISKIRGICAELSPAFPVEIRFLDSAVEDMYQSEVRFRRTFSVFAGCAILLCCLGILALSLFACQHRIKEIGIRKVYGAKVNDVMIMLNRDFLKWVAVAFVIACPFSWYGMSRWLENYAYRTAVSWWLFALAGVVALGIAVATVSWQTWRVANRNPVEALRYE